LKVPGYERLVAASLNGGATICWQIVAAGW
jgi:hypothetical protein